MKLPLSMHPEPQQQMSASTSNWLRAAVLGANDGIISLSALLVGVAGATATLSHILIIGIAGLLAGVLSMAVGEYVSVSSQRDVELALLAKEREELRLQPAAELEELTVAYQKRGLSRPTAEVVARELTARDAFAAHVEAELGGIHPENLTNPWHAAVASAASFFSGAVIPLIAITLPPAAWRIPTTFAAVLVALVITGIFSARMSGSKVPTVIFRVVVGGVAAMLITFGIGRLFGVATG